MGADCHVFVERQLPDGTWIQVPDSEGPISNCDYPKNHNLYREWDLARNYSLFGLLAGVRNRDIDPIAQPKGLPKDLSKEVFGRWENNHGWHTPSFYTAQELLETKDKPIKFYGYLSIKDYKKFLKNGKVKPITVSSYYMPTYDTSLISNQEMERIINLTSFLGEDNFYTKVEWYQPAYTISSQLFEQILPAMLKVESDPEKIRMVFWFDS